MGAGVTTAAPADAGMDVARDPGSLRQALAAKHGRRALVMTMGALHEGHLSLVREARRYADHVVVTIFVNPAQFAPGEDYERYPRTLEADLAALAGEGVEVVYAPEPSVVYPGRPQVRLDPGPMATVLEGACRPSHFAGVALVVTKMLNLIRPDVAVFGQKDAQQLAILRRLAADLDMGVQIIGAPISREPDGLARSSRNAYLSVEGREHARALSRSLQAGTVAARQGAAAQGVAEAARAVLESEDGVETDYVALVDPATFQALDSPRGPGLLLVAARVGDVRLIDNTEVRWRPGPA